jgi:hypothetical protein
MQGSKINLASDNLPLSTHKRKGVTRKALVHKCMKKKKKKIDIVVVNIFDMAGKLSGAFEVELSSTFPFFLRIFS